MTEPDSTDEEWVSNLKRKARIAEVRDAIKWAGMMGPLEKVPCWYSLPLKQMEARKHFGDKRFALYWNARPLVRLKSLLTNMWEAR